MATNPILRVQNGRVEYRDSKGNMIKYVGEHYAVDVKMAGDGFIITYENSREAFHNEDGSFLRYL
ncbi:MAG: hypothetical protein LBN93_09745 [Candidatus Symbiothrix sp.]|jgi:hypothetical protein|nr:hypothetical protein [Candidatus Symbiothrix sp.]